MKTELLKVNEEPSRWARGSSERASSSVSDGDGLRAGRKRAGRARGRQALEAKDVRRITRRLRMSPAWKRFRRWCATPVRPRGS